VGKTKKEPPSGPIRTVRDFEKKRAKATEICEVNGVLQSKRDLMTGITTKKENSEEGNIKRGRPASDV